MIKAIVKDEAELKSLETQKGYQVHFGEGDEAIVGGVHIILIGGAWADYEAHMKAIQEAEAERIKAEEKKAEVQ
jgi:hypothetical protein